MLIITSASHLDHGITAHVLDYVLKRFAHKNEFFIESFDVGVDLACGLYGPAMGDSPITEEEVHYAPRNGREWMSRLVNKPVRTSQTVTIVAGPHGDNACVLYTAFGGPRAPKEPGDPSHTPDSLKESEAFWAQHALYA